MAKNIRISITSALNAAGIEATKQQLDRLAKHVQDSKKKMSSAGSETNKSWMDLGDSFNRAKESLLKLGGVFVGVVAAFKSGYKVGEWISRNIFGVKNATEEAKKAQEQYNDALAKARAEQIKGITDEYKAIASAINAATAARQRDNRVLEQQLNLIHKSQDAERELAKYKRLNAIDPNDEAGRDKVEREFSQMGEMAAAMRVEEAAVIQRQALEQEAQDAEKAAQKIEGVMKRIEAQLVRAKTRMGTNEKLSTMLNSFDGTWYNKNKRTEDGDKERERLKKAAEEARKDVEKLTVELEARKAEAEKYRAEAADAMRRHEGLGKAFENADTMRRVAAEKEVDAARDAANKIKKLREEKLKELEKKAAETYGSDKPGEMAAKKLDSLIAQAKEKVKTATEELAGATTEAEINAAAKILDAELANVKKLLTAKKEADRNEAESKKTLLQKLHDEHMKQIDREIAAAKKEADELEKNAARARGKSFGDWQRGERDLARQKRTEDGQNEKNINAAKNELKRLEERQRRSPRSMTRGQRERMAKLREYLIDQDPKNNPAMKKAQELEAKKQKLAEDTLKRLEEIAKTLKEKTGM